MKNDLTVSQWHELLAVLSLDCAQPFYEKMQVPIPAQSQPLFLKFVRESILTGRNLLEMQPDRIPAVAELLFSRLSPSVAVKNLQSWSRCVYLGYHADQPDWSAWDIVFSQWAYSRANDLAFLPATKARAIVSGYRSKVETQDLKLLWREQLKSKLSDWDLRMFDRHGYGISCDSSPFYLMDAMARIMRLMKMCRELWPQLTEAERNDLQQCAKNLVSDLNVWLPGDLPDLGTLLASEHDQIFR